MPTNFLNENPLIKLRLDHKLDKNAVIELLLWMIIGDCFLSISWTFSVRVALRITNLFIGVGWSRFENVGRISWFPTCQSRRYALLQPSDFPCIASRMVFNALSIHYRVRERKWHYVLNCNISVIIISFCPLFGIIRKPCLSTFRIILPLCDSFRIIRVMSW